LIALTPDGASNTAISTGMPYMKAVSLKQSFLSMINSITVDLNEQSMIQQNQLLNIRNHFRLLTSESWTSQNRWSTIGLYPDVSEAGGFATANRKFAPATTTSNNSNLNIGLSERLQYILNDTGETLDRIATSSLSNLISTTELNFLYISHLSRRTSGVSADATTNSLLVSSVLQYSVKATIMLKDIHPLFEVMPIFNSLNF